MFIHEAHDQYNLNKLLSSMCVGNQARTARKIARINWTKGSFMTWLTVFRTEKFKGSVHGYHA